MTEPMCKHCKFFRPSHWRDGGDCLRYPPVWTETHKTDRFPAVKDIDCCGEFKHLSA